MILSDTHKTVLQILAASMNDHSSRFECHDNWYEILKELSNHAVASIPGVIISELGLNDEQYQSYQNQIGDNFRQFYQVLLSQKKLLAILDSNNIKTAILKGSSAAINYPRPDMRSMGDIDLIVRPEDFERCRGLLTISGYSREDEGTGTKRHNNFRDSKGIEIELHRYFSTSKDERQNEALDSLIYKALDKTEIQSINGFSFPMLPPDENGIVLIAHINQHLGSGLGLRQICDWMAYVDKYLDDQQWEQSFKALVSEIGMERLAITVTSLCKKYLGLRESITWCDKADEALCDDLMEYVMTCGNFGIKTEYASRKTSSVLMFLRKPKTAFKYLQNGGRSHWRAIGKHPWLENIAWMYQIYHLIHMGLKGDISYSTIKDSSKEVQRRSLLMERLGVTRF